MLAPDAPRRPLLALVLPAPALLLLLAFLAGPFLLLLRLGFGTPAADRGFSPAGAWTIENYTALLTDPYSRQVLVFTLLFGLGVTALVLVLAVPLSVFVHALPPRQKTVALAAIVLPKLASMLVVVYGLQAMLSNSGIVNQTLQAIGFIKQPMRLSRNLFGAVLGETYLLLPYAVLVLVVSLGRIDPHLFSAARGLGASPWQAFRRVTLPLLAPGLAVAAQLTLAWALGAFVGPLLLGSPSEWTLSVEVQRQTIENNRWPQAAATAGLLLLVVVLLLAASGLFLRLLTKRSER
jgi:ABC-type spermidine/putrescine transport system permease subunit I